MSTATLTPTGSAESSTSFELPKKIKSVTDVNDVARVLITLKRQANQVDEEEAVQAARKVIADAQARKQALEQQFNETFEAVAPKIEKFVRN